MWRTVVLVKPIPGNGRNIERAATALRSGELVAFPTETVYGLGADATNATAVARIYEAKGRPSFNPLIIHAASQDAARALGQWDPVSLALARAFWPGALTLVVKRAADCPICDLATAGLDTLAIRVPVHPLAQELLAASNLSIAAPSANRSGHVSPTTANHVAADLGDSLSVILDGGPCPVGLESTIIDASDARAGRLTLLRPGGITLDEIKPLAGPDVDVIFPSPAASDSAPIAPGQLSSHYATKAPIRLNATSVGDGEALIAFGPNVPAHSGPMINLSPVGDVVEAAARLFAALREIDGILGAEHTKAGSRRIAVMPIPMGGLGSAINDRLSRAAAPRPSAGEI